MLEKVGFGAGDAAVNVVWSSMALILTFFYTDIFGLKTVDLGILLLSVRFIDAITDPLMGTLTDHYTTRWGRYRHYFLFLAVPFGVTVYLTFLTPDFGYNAKLVWAYSTYILVTLVFTAVTIPYISLIGVLTDQPKERLSANGYRLFFAKVAAFCVSIVVPILAKTWGQANLAAGYQAAMGLMGALAAILFLFCFFTTTERLQHKVEKTPFRTKVSHLVRNDQWIVLCAVCVIGTIGYVIRGSVAAYYAKYYIGGDEVMISKFLGTGVIGNILAMVASTWITKRFCKVAMFRWTQLTVAALSVITYFTVKPGDVVSAFILYFLINFVVDLQAPVFWSAIAEAIDYGEKKSGLRVTGLSWGLISFCQKAGMALAGFLLAQLLDHYGYVANQVQTPAALMGIALMLTIIPGVFHGIMGLLMFRYRITDKFYDAMMRGEGAKAGLTANHISETPVG